MITANSPEMKLTEFFSIWIPKLYPGLKYSDPGLRQETKTPEGTTELLTWKQACIRELENNWKYSRQYAEHLNFRRSSTPLKEKAYLMNIAYQKHYGQQA